MTNISRRIITALILVFVLSFSMTICVYAIDNRPELTLNGNADKKMDAMGEETFIWYRAFRSCIIPLLIVRFAFNGLKLMGSTFLQKNEYTMNGIIQDIFYSTIAAIVLILLPTVLGWAMKLFKSGGWMPPAPSEPTEGGVKLW